MLLMHCLQLLFINMYIVYRYRNVKDIRHFSTNSFKFVKLKLGVVRDLRDFLGRAAGRSIGISGLSSPGR